MFLLLKQIDNSGNTFIYFIIYLSCDDDDDDVTRLNFSTMHEGDFYKNHW